MLQITDREESDSIWRPLVNENFYLICPFKKKKGRRPQTVENTENERKIYIYLVDSFTSNEVSDQRHPQLTEEIKILRMHLSTHMYYSTVTSVHTPFSQ